MQKFIAVEGLERPVLLARRKGVRNIRLSIKSDGQLRVSVPYGVPELFAKKFIKDKIQWIEKHQKPTIIIKSPSHIGKNHQLVVTHSSSPRPHTKVTNNDIRVSLPFGLDETSIEAQKIIKKACDKALSVEANILLPQRLKFLSAKHKITYSSCTIKKLKSRWGACDNHSNISLNSYLIQLDWQLIDYVICHELAHTIHHNHQSDFWKLVLSICPDFKNLRKTLKTMQTDVVQTTF